MEVTGNTTTDLLNCLSWLVLTIALIFCMIKIVNSYVEVKHAIRDKIRSQIK